MLRCNSRGAKNTCIAAFLLAFRPVTRFLHTAITQIEQSYGDHRTPLGVSKIVLVIDFADYSGRMGKAAGFTAGERDEQRLQISTAISQYSRG